MSIAADYLLDNVLLAIEENKPISKYKDSYLISYGNNNIEHLWS